MSSLTLKWEVIWAGWWLIFYRIIVICFLNKAAWCSNTPISLLLKYMGEILYINLPRSIRIFAMAYCKRENECFSHITLVNEKNAVKNVIVFFLLTFQKYIYIYTYIYITYIYKYMQWKLGYWLLDSYLILLSTLHLSINLRWATGKFECTSQIWCPCHPVRVYYNDYLAVHYPTLELSLSVCPSVWLNSISASK